MNILKKIFELKIEVIEKNVERLEDLERPWRKEYEEIKKRIYFFTAKD